MCGYLYTHCTINHMTAHPENGKNKYLHDVKGPTHLSPAQIKDIVESRPNPHARDEMSKKHGISVNRVGNIWKDYYGGTTLKDYKSGLKKELPTDIVKTADITTRRFKSERGQYSAKDPKVIDHANAKAQAIRRVAAMPSSQKKVNAQTAGAHDLDLDNTDDMGDNEAQILAGEVSAGNNSSELLAAIQMMLEHNQNISDRAVTALEKALKAAHKSKGNNYNTDTDYETTDIDESTNDDSTVAYKKPANPRARPQSRGQSNRPSEGYSEEPSRYGNGECDQEYYGDDIQCQPAVAVHQNSAVRLARPNTQREGLWEDTTGSGTRAQPVYRTERNRPPANTDEEQSRAYQNNRSKPEVSTAEHDPRQRGLQQNLTYNDTKRYSQSGTSVNIPGGGGDRSSQTVSGISWLHPRKG